MWSSLSIVGKDKITISMTDKGAVRVYEEVKSLSSEEFDKIKKICLLVF